MILFVFGGNTCEKRNQARRADEGSLHHPKRLRLEGFGLTVAILRLFFALKPEKHVVEDANLRLCSA